MKIHCKKACIIIFLLIGFSIFFLWQNNHITITTMMFKNLKIPKDFQGYKILHISDLHNKRFGEKQYKLLEKITEIRPNIIVITGDLIDSRHTDIQTAMEFINGAIEIAPLYYVPGNHESRLENYPEISAQLLEVGVFVLEDKVVILKENNSEIALMGISDPSFSYTKDSVEMQLEELAQVYRGKFKLLLSHRPELMNLYVKNHIELVFSGHAHGGQFRFPFIGGLIAPDQGFLPKYTDGMYNEKNTTMVVSRGLGNSIIPIRVFNRPEIIVVYLNK